MGLVAICFRNVYEFQVFRETAFTKVLRIAPPFFFYKSDLGTAFYQIGNVVLTALKNCKPIPENRLFYLGT